MNIFKVTDVEREAEIEVRGILFTVNIITMKYVSTSGIHDRFKENCKLAKQEYEFALNYNHQVDILRQIHLRATY